MPKAILFDLDGTLVQTRESSWVLFQRVNDEFGLGVQSQDEYFQLLEGNLFHALRELAGPRAEEVGQRFLDLLKVAYNPPFVPGMVDVIKSMAGSCSLAVVSSNAMVTIRRILESAGLQHCFSHVFGGDVERDKRACVRRFLADAEYLVNRHCAPSYVEGHRPEGARGDQIFLVTDTVGDVKHALECGVRVVGVSWGMHSEHKLRNAGAEFVAIWPQEIVSHLYPNGLPTTACTIESRHPVSPACDCEEAAACACDLGAALADSTRIRRNRRLAMTTRLERTVTLELGEAASKAPQPVNGVLLDSIQRISRGGPAFARHPAPASRTERQAPTTRTQSTTLLSSIRRIGRSA